MPKMNINSSAKVRISGEHNFNNNMNFIRLFLSELLGKKLKKK